jgi:SAM-dependent methyltransferase
MSLAEQAASFRQYDGDGMDWEKSGSADSYQRQFMKRAIALQPGEVAGRRVLDVGCGGGWFLQTCLDAGAASVCGIEPSKYALVAQKLVPNAEIIQTTFEAYEPSTTFGLVSFVMSTEHLPDLPKVLTKARSLLDTNGEILVLAADLDAFSMERYDYVLEKEVSIPRKELAIQTKRPTDYGTTTDFVRSVEYWLESARQANLEVMPQQPVMCDEQLIAASPKYELFRHQPLFQLFRFAKVA